MIVVSDTAPHNTSKVELNDDLNQDCDGLVSDTVPVTL